MRSSHRPAVVVGAAAAVLALAVAAAATAGDWDLEQRDYGPFELHRSPEPLTLPPMPTVSGEPEPGDGSSWLTAIDWRILAMVLGLALGLLIAAWLIRRWRRFAPPAEPDAGQVAGAGGALALAEPALPPLIAAARAALEALGSAASSDDAIVAAWLAVERGAADSGVARRPAQTATEFTVSVLERTSADPAAIATLRGLYLRARYAHGDAAAAHRTGPAEVAQAAACMQALERAWAAGAAEVAQ